MKKFSTLILLLAVASTSLFSKQLAPTAMMESETRWVLRCLQRQHYLQEDLSQLDMKDFVKEFISEIDSQKSYLLQPEVDEFINRFGSTMVSYLKDGDLYPAFTVFDLFQEKTSARMKWVKERLKQPFDFTKDETFNPDRGESDWEESAAALDALWEKRLRYELLNYILAEMFSEESDDKEEGLEAEKEEEETVASSEEADTEETSEKTTFEEALEQALEDLNKRYDNLAKVYNEYEAVDVQEIYLNAFTQMYDPHTTFLSVDTFEDFNIAMKNSFVGIGAVLSSDDGYCVIKELLPGGPAEASRSLNPADSIVGVAQGSSDFTNVIGMKLRKIVKLIKGPKNTVVRLLIKPADSPERKVVSLLRDEIKLTANLAKAEIIEVPSNNETIPVGVIDLPSFYSGNPSEDGSSGTTHDVEELINKLKESNIKGLVLDFRRNGGGALEEAVRLTGLFISQGPVVQVRDTIGNIKNYMDYDPKIVWDGPLMVLASKYSASASEIVAGALHDHSRAMVIGDTSTHGKGTVQALLPMEVPFFGRFQDIKRSAVKVTIRKFYLPSGHSTQIRGVPADISLPSINEFLPVAESDLPNAMEWDQISPILLPYEDTNVVSVNNDIVDILKSSSLLRQENLEEFDYLNKSISWFKKQKDKEEISLNLENRIEQREKESSFRKDMKDTLAKLSENAFAKTEVLLNITLDQEEKSRKVRENDDEELSEEVDAEEEEEDPDFDIRLRESVRIMADWILHNQNKVADQAKQYSL